MSGKQSDLLKSTDGDERGHFSKIFCCVDSDSLWLQVAPSQPSLQTHRNEFPCTVHVPPFSQGLGRQLLFLAVEGQTGNS